MSARGMIADIQRCSLHDGPGIRTTVFFKGCPLHCAWCHNPECIDPAPETLFYAEKCIHCGICVEHCPVPGKAVNFTTEDRNAPPSYDYSKCIRCYCCQEMCPQHAIKVKGRS